MLPQYRSVRYAQAKPVVTVGAYAAKDAVGGKLTFAEIAPSANSLTYILGIMISDAADQKAPLELFLFNSTKFNAVADNAAFDPANDDLINLFVTRIKVAAEDYSSLADNAEAFVLFDKPMPVICDARRQLYGQFMTTGTPTYAETTDLTVKLIIGLPQ